MNQSSPSLAIPPVALVMLSIVSTQLGSAIAKPLFAQISPVAVVSLRLFFAALILGLWQRPRWRDYGRSEYRLIVGFGLSIALMNGFFYSAIARIPLGIAVTLEFLGPLGVALLKSRQRLDILWIAMAGTGVLLLSPIPRNSLDPLGLGYALLAALGWGCYILMSAKAGESLTAEVLPIVLTVAMLAVLPLGWSQGGWAMLQPRVLALGAVVALLSSVMTYSLEMAALQRLAINVFGVLMSLEPAIASLLGWLILGEHLSWRSLLAMVLVSMAAAGIARRQPTS